MSEPYPETATAIPAQPRATTMPMHSQTTPQGLLDHERATVANALDVEPDDIKLADDGWTSRAYLVDEGAVVFKFPRSGGGIDIYSSEIAALNLVETLPGEVRTQRLRSRDPYGQYVSYYGLEGVQLVSLYDTLDSAEKQHIGRKIGMFLSQLHELDLDGVQQITADDEVAEFQEKYHLLQPEIEEAFTPEERSLIAKLFMEIMPAEVAALGEDSCLSHGDLTPENIIIGSDGSVGVIDFSNVGYYDRSRDFIDIGDDTVRDAALEAYGADDLLRRKIAIRKIAQTAIDWAYYIHKHDVRGVARTIDQLRLGIQQLFHN